MASHRRTHFLDRISAAFRQKLSAHRLLRPDAMKSSLLEKLRPPAELRTELLPLYGLCTYKLLEDLRYGDANPVEWDTDTVSESIGDWFSQLRETTSEWTTTAPDINKARWDGMTRQGLLSNQWKCMGEELLALDKVTRVPRDAPEIQKIYRAVRAVPEYIVKKGNQQKGGEILNNLRLIGSFACDNKVRDLDEFDFLVHAMTDDYHLKFDGIFTCTKLSNDEWNLLHNNPDLLDAEPSIVGFYFHGPAICTTLGWRCQEGHVHDMGVDLTVGTYDETLSCKEVWRNMKGTVFAPVYDSIPNDEHCVIVGNSTTALLDERLFTFLLDRSPNITAAYRLMKIIFASLLPKNISLIVKKFQEFESSSMVSSHKLKLILYDCFMSHSHRDDWKAEHLHERIAEMLQTLIGDRQLSNPFTSGDTFTDIAEKDGKSPGLGDIRMKKHLQEFHYLLVQFKDILLAPYDRSRHEIQDCPHQFPRRVALLLYARGKWHPCDSDNLRLVLKGNKNSIGFKIDSPAMLFSSHPLVQWCKANIHCLYSDSPGPDLSTLSFIDPWVWAPYADGVLSADDLSNDDTMKAAFIRLKLHTRKLLHECVILPCMMVGRYHYDTVHLYITGFPDESLDPFTELSQCIPTLTHRERALICRWCHLLLPGKEDKLINSHLCECSRVSERVNRLARALEYIYVILRRADGRKKPRYYRAQSLVYMVMYHMLQKDPAYIDNVTDEYLQWADDIIDHVTSYTRTEQIQVRNTEGEQTWGIIRVERNFNSFLRCLLAYLNKGPRESRRSYSGMILNHSVNNFVKFIIRHPVELLKDIWRYVPTKYINIQNYEQLVMVGTAIWYRRQVHVYEYMTGEEGVAVHTRTIPREVLEGRVPISVLLTPGRGCSLLLPPGSEHWGSMHGEQHQGSLDMKGGVDIWSDVDWKWSHTDNVISDGGLSHADMLSHDGGRADTYEEYFLKPEDVFDSDNPSSDDEMDV